MMGWLITAIVKMFSGWTFVEFCRGVMVNMFSSLITSGGGVLFSKFKPSKDDEEILRKCFDKAICKNVKNSDIACYMRDHEDDKYLTALKKELLTSEHSFAEGTSDANILRDFQKELSKHPFYTIRLIRLFGKEICTSSRVTLDKLNEQIREIQKIKEQGAMILATVQTLTAKTGYTLNITDSMSGEFECPIPEKVFTRKNLVQAIKTRLLNNGSIYLYGGYKTGKSVLSCLVISEFTDYAKVRIPLDYKNILSIKDVVNRYDKKDKIIFVIDGIPYKDETIIMDLCNYVVSQDKCNWLFFLNGRQPISQFTTTATQVEEVAMPLLDRNEIAELIPKASAFLTTAILSLSGGNPMIAVLMIQMLEKLGWPKDSEALYALFGFSKDASFNDKFRSILMQIIPNRDSVRLLNRLLLVKTPFTRETSRQLASLDPVISLPDSCFDDLMNIAISDNGNNEYVITPAFSKTLTPDLLKQELYSCNHWLAEQILSRRELNELDVARVLSHLLDGGEYDRAGFFYISCLLNIQEKKNSFHFLSGIWIDLNLPEGMDNEVKVLVRILQIITFGITGSDKNIYIARDLEQLLKENGLEPYLLRFAYQVLYFYYGSLGHVEKALAFMGTANSLPSRPELSLQIEDTLSMTLFKVNTMSDLYVWFETYAKQGYPTFEFKEEMCNKAVSNIISSCEAGEKENCLKAIIAKAESISDELQPFIISAEANLIFYYGGLKEWQKAVDVYNKSKYNETEFGKLLLNYSLGLCYYDNGMKSEAEQSLKKALEVEHIEINAINVLYAYIYYAAIVGERNQQDAVDVLLKIYNYPSFMKIFVEPERVLLYGELAFAMWKNNNKVEAIAFMQRLNTYIWSGRDDMDDSKKGLLVKLSLLVSHCYGDDHNIKYDEEKYAKPFQTMFVVVNDKSKDYFESHRVLATNFYLYELQEDYLWNDGYSLDLLDNSLSMYRGSVISTHAEYATIFLKCLPELLNKDRFDDVNYIIIQSAYAVKKFPEIIKHPEGAVLVSSLYYVLLYRIDKLITTRQFDDSSLITILNDFINIYPNDSPFAHYLLELCEGKAVYNINYSHDTAHQSILLLWHLLNEDSIRQWFVALQRIHVSINSMNNSKACGDYLEKVTTDILYYILDAHPDSFYQDKRDALLVRLNNYRLFERSRAVLAAFYYLMKKPPVLSSDVEDLIDLS